MPHRYTLRVYYEDTDAGGIVYHAGYLRFAERARTEAMRDAGVPHAELTRQHGLLFVVRRIEMDYLRPARLDDLVAVESEPVAVGGASVVIRQDFAVAGEPVARLRVSLACVHQQTGRPARLPARWRDALANGLEAAARTAAGRG